MAALFIYILKVNLALSIVYGTYVLLFRTTTHFSLNRFFLLGGLAISFVIPLITLSAITPVVAPPITALEAPVYDATSSTGDVFGGDYINSTPDVVGFIILAVYFLGVIIMFLRSFASIVRVKFPSGKKYRIGHARVIRAACPGSYAFFRTIIISERQDTHTVFLHEKAHVAQLHWLDLIILEVALITSWFNPVMWMYRQSVRLQLEYLADKYVIDRGVSITNYLRSLLDTLPQRNASHVTNQFNSNPLKNRILMITKQSSAKSRFIYLLILPLVCFLVAAFSTRDATVSDGDNGLTVVVDAGHGGNDSGSKTGHLTEKDLSLDLAHKLKAACSERGIKVILTRSDDREMALKDRVAVARDHHADLFISIHLDDNASGKPGADLLVSELNPNYEESLRIASLLEKKLNEERPVNGVKNSSALVARDNAVSAVIIQLANIGLEEDRIYISKEENRVRLASLIAEALAEFKR